MVAVLVNVAANLSTWFGACFLNMVNHFYRVLPGPAHNFGPYMAITWVECSALEWLKVMVKMWQKKEIVSPLPLFCAYAKGREVQLKRELFLF